MKKIILFLLILAVSFTFMGSAKADNTQGSLSVYANIMPVCAVYTNQMYFSGYPGSGNLAGNGDVQVNCANGTTYHIALSSGQNYSGTSRRVVGNFPYSTDYLNYKIYKDGGYGEDWGDSDYANTYPGGSSIVDVGNGIVQSHTAYGLLSNSLIAPTTQYYDVVTVNVDF